MGSSPLPVSIQSKLQKARGSSPLQTIARNIDILRNLIFALFLLRITRKSYYYLRGHGILGSIFIFYHTVHKRLFKLFLSAPGVRGKVNQQLAAARKDIETKLVNHGPGTIRYLALPKEPWTPEQLDAELEKLAALKRTRWEEGKVSGAVYHGEDQLLEIQAKSMKLFSVANPIHADVFPAVRKMEAEVVAMTLAMFNGPEGSAGATTSGGTESILMACLSARQKAYNERGVTEPEMVFGLIIRRTALMSTWYEGAGQGT